MVTETEFDPLESARIFMPLASRTREAFLKSTRDFVHYAPASAAMEIIRKKQVWMRNTNLMNDYQEVQHGIERLAGYINDQNKRNAFFNAVDKVHKGVGEEALDLFIRHASGLRFSTYITSISEHERDEDDHGRLSMWRAYGNAPGRVAMVLNREVFFQPSNALNAWTSPVAYLSDADFSKAFDEVVSNVTSATTYLRTISRQNLLNVMFMVMAFAAVSTKHPGFREEREWRIVYMPSVWESKVLETVMECVNGLPQRIYKIPLRDYPNEGLTGLELPKLLKRLIIGPTQFGMPLYHAFVELLKAEGVQDAERKVVVSGIPIRD